MISIEYYNKSAEEFFEKNHNLNLTDTYNFAMEYIPELGEGGLSILDVGCGTGRDAVEFAKKNHNVIGFDGSYRMTEIAINQTKKYDNIKILNSTFEDFEPENVFDIIWAQCSLLHVKYDCLGEIFKKYGLWLRDDNSVFFISFKFGVMRHRVDGERKFTDLTADSLVSALKGTNLKLSGYKIVESNNQKFILGILKKEG
ncbi:class I SAM-dependent methyltransferase [Photobacterium leiognathi]|uniref:class I SAM-dependent methyltransferase n=1 Tax=Photobacterium leiognathi TaxID=553611 RepID=UPI002982176F|nr:methyltransferase domain-containing protein [Photobacterium leiognathi]